jgi:hypothetical protein
MAGRKAYEPTDKDIETVQKMKEKGATDAACAKAINISVRTFQKHKKAVFAETIKRGQEIRTNNLLSIYEDNLPKQLSGYYVEEEVERINPVSGEFELAERRKKWMPPNATLMMFTAVNKSDGEWQSINKVEQKVQVNEVPKIQIEIVE